jgi:hypothetical protein
LSWFARIAAALMCCYAFMGRVLHGGKPNTAQFIPHETK